MVGSISTVHASSVCQACWCWPHFVCKQPNRNHYALKSNVVPYKIHPQKEEAHRLTLPLWLSPSPCATRPLDQVICLNSRLWRTRANSDLPCVRGPSGPSASGWLLSVAPETLSGFCLPRTSPGLEAMERPLRPPVLAKATPNVPQETRHFGKTGGPTALSIAQKGNGLEAQAQQL